MKYMLLIYNNPELQPAYGSPEFDEMMAGFYAANEKMVTDGVLVDGESLAEPDTAMSVRSERARP